MRTAHATARATEVDTFEALARRHLPRLYALARRLVGGYAEDLVQECLLRGYRGYRALRDPVAMEGWLMAILLNCAKDRYRYLDARVREVSVDPVDRFSLYRTIASEDPLPYSDSLHLDFLCNFGPEDVWAVLSSLPELYRVPLVLVHMESRPASNVAAFLGVPAGTLYARLHRGRKLFERELWRYATENDLLRVRRSETDPATREASGC